MRISCDHEDPGYPEFRHACAVGKSVNIRFNGERKLNVITADEELGYLKVYRTDEEGDLILDELRENILVEELIGDVFVSIT